MKKAVYAGSFDPWTKGHLYIYEEALQLFDEVYILIAANTGKSRLTDSNKMKDKIINSLYQHFGTEFFVNKNIEDNIIILDDLVARYCRNNQIDYSVRGIRNTMDWLYEENLRKSNLEVWSSLKTLYFPAKDDAISSSLVKELNKYGENVDRFLPYYKLNQVLI